MRAFAVLALLMAVACTPPPMQPECARYRDCASCAAAYCGWCDGVGEPAVGCYSVREPRICGPAVRYIPDCTADVTDPAYYQLRHPRDGGTP